MMDSLMDCRQEWKGEEARFVLLGLKMGFFVQPTE